jgi:hypothetical protein
MQIQITPDLEEALIARARQSNQVPEPLALELLRQQLAAWTSVSATLPDTLTAFLADQIGVIGSEERQPGGARLSEKTGKRFAELLGKC